MCRGIRGATTATGNTKEAILTATSELLREVTKANDLSEQNMAAVWFTTTPDLNAQFPALAAREMGWTQVALLCGHEMAVPDDVPQCIRILLLVNTGKGQNELKHIYLNGATNLRNRSAEAQ